MNRMLHNVEFLLLIKKIQKMHTMSDNSNRLSCHRQAGNYPLAVIDVRTIYTVDSTV